MGEQKITDVEARQKPDDHVRQRREPSYTGIEQTIIKKARDWWGDEAKSLRIVNHFPHFAAGSLYCIWVTDEKGKQDDDMVAYVVGDEIKLCYDFQELGNSVGKTPGVWERLGQVLQLGGIAGIIAVILTVTFAVLVLRGGQKDGTELIDLMKNALLLILGFYFGSKVTK